jgi:hypothetical protein
VFRLEDGEWKVVHRHADPAGSPNAGDVLHQLAALTTPNDPPDSSNPPTDESLGREIGIPDINTPVVSAMSDLVNESAGRRAR